MFQPRQVRVKRITELAATLRTAKTFAAVRWGRRFRTRQQLLAYQNKHLRKHFKFLAQHSKYFASLITPTTQLTDLPLMDKQGMMANFDDLTTTGITRETALEGAIAQEKNRDFAAEINGYSVGLSSGTSGHRGLFLTSRSEQEEWAGTMLARALPPGKLLGHRIALFLRADNNLYERAGSKAVSFKYFDIYTDMGQNLEELAVYSPIILVAPPSVLHVIADYFTKSPSCDFPGSAFDRVFSAAEVLERKDSQHFAHVFGQKIIHQIYQCTEGFLAITCTHGRIHLNEDVAIFEREYVGPDRFIPIVTDFRRTSQPIIRYRLNDVLVEDKTLCPCGSVFTSIARVEGREDDVLLFPGAQDPTAQVTIFADMISRSMVYAEGFTHYRVVQTGNTHLDIYLDVLREQTIASVTAELTQLLAQQGAAPCTYRFLPYHHQVGVKMRRVERSLPHA